MAEGYFATTSSGVTYWETAAPPAKRQRVHYNMAVAAATVAHAAVHTVTNFLGTLPDAIPADRFYDAVPAAVAATAMVLAPASKLASRSSRGYVFGGKAPRRLRMKRARRH